MNKRKKAGILLIVLPVAFLTAILVIYAVVSFFMVSGAISTENNQTLNYDLNNQIDVGDQDINNALGSTVNVTLGLLGLLAVLMIMIGGPLGIYLLATNKAITLEELMKGEKYKGLTAEQVKFISGWSFGAFFSPLIWGLGNKLYWQGVLSLIPIYGLYVWLKLSLDGRRLAWERGWQNFNQFKARQKTVAFVIVGLLAFWVFLIAIFEWLKL